MDDIVAEVFCTLQFEGIHSWPECPIEEVNFLRVPHRHIFHIKAWTFVSHDDRDQEFIVLKRSISDHLAQKYPRGELGRTSCEMLARELIRKFDLSRCEVSEDNENGAILTRV